MARTACLLPLFLSLLAAWAPTHAVAAQAQAPNIVLLLTDDQSTRSLGCYGNSEVSTPHIDALSRAGVTFDRHYATTAICMASRAGLMTGLYEFKHGCNFDHGPLRQAHWHRSYPVLLRQAGYTTAFAGKLGFTVLPPGANKPVLPEGDFDRWGGGPGQTHYQTAKNPSIAHYAADYPHASRAYGAFGRDFITHAAAGGKPFCLSISFKAPHKPDQPDPAFNHVYAGKAFTRPGNYGRENGRHLPEQSRRGRQYARFIDWGYRDRYDRAMATYHQLVHGVDAAVGMIQQALVDAGVDDNTVILFTSDNGFFNGAHGLGSKVLAYEEASRVPLIIVDPRQAGTGSARRSAALTANVDLYSTVLDLAGVPTPAGVDGQSLLPLLDDPQGSVRESVMLINAWGPEACHSLAVVSGAYKYIYWPYAGQGMTPAEELYNLARDPGEMHNASGDLDEQRALEAMRGLYDDAVAAWKRDAVAYHRYPRFGDLFDRHTPWRAGALKRKTPREP